MSVGAVRVRLAQQRNNNTSHPRHDSFAPLVPFAPLVCPPERGAAVQILVLNVWARQTGSKIVTRSEAARLGLACACLPHAVFAKALHDLTLTRLDWKA
jgi:hypothetical protein